MLILTTVFLGVLSLADSVGFVALEGMAGFFTGLLLLMTSTTDLLLTVVSRADPLLEEVNSCNSCYLSNTECTI